MELVVSVMEESPEVVKVVKDLDHETLLKVTAFFSELVLAEMKESWSYLSKDMARMAIMMRVDWVIRNVGIFDKRVDDREDKQIKFLSETGFTVGQIAYIVGRSKSTVHAHL